MSTTISEMTLYNIEEILPLYIDYYNNNEGACWARDTASKRIHQVLSIEDSYSLILRDEGNAANFVMKVKWID